jgi:hypothetical protein
MTSGVYKRTPKILVSLSKAHLGKVSGNKGKKQVSTEEQKERRTLALPRGEKHWNWKGNEVDYRALHYWVERRLGKPQCCDLCGTIERKKYHWANKSGKYKRDINDWIRVCVKCHKNYDKKEGT